METLAQRDCYLSRGPEPGAGEQVLPHHTGVTGRAPAGPASGEETDPNEREKEKSCKITRRPGPSLGANQGLVARDLPWDCELLSSSALGRRHPSTPAESEGGMGVERRFWGTVFKSRGLSASAERLYRRCLTPRAGAMLTMLVSMEIPSRARCVAVFRSGPFLFGFHGPRDLEGLPHVPRLWSPCCSAPVACIPGSWVWQPAHSRWPPIDGRFWLPCPSQS